MRKYIRLALALALLLAVTAATPPRAAADYWHGEVYYYSDACYTTQIGYFVRYCNNTKYQSGQTSAYSTEHPFNCDEPIDP